MADKSGRIAYRLGAGIALAAGLVDDEHRAALIKHAVAKASE